MPPRIRAALSCAILAAVSATPMIATTASLLLVPISAEFHWARIQFPLVILVAAWLGGLTAPLAGWIIDRVGVRWVLAAGLIVFALANGLAALSDGKPLHTYPTYMLLGASSTFSGVIGLTKVISAWFHRERGRALGLTIGVGVGVGSALTPVLVHLGVETVGWRGAYCLMAAMIALVGLPVVLLLLPRELPPFEEQLVRGDGSAGLPVAAALRTREFWLLAALVTANSLAAGAFGGHLAPMLTGRGVSLGLATGLLGGVGLLKILAQYGGGYLLDRFQTPLVAAALMLPVCAGLALVALTTAAPLLIAGVGLFGLGEGAELSLLPYLISRYFGVRRIGLHLGIFAALAIIFAALGNVGMGRLFDVTGSYAVGTDLAPWIAAAAVLAAALLGPYRVASRETGAPSRDEAKRDTATESGPGVV